MAMRGPRHPIGAVSWIAEERTTALHIAQSEVEEFMFSAKNELDWLNEHMAEIFSENQINVADIFKTPGKLRGRTPRTARKVNKGDIRAPLTDVFSSTPKGAPNPFAVSKLTTLKQHQRRQSPTFTVAEDKPAPPRKSQSPQRVVPARAATTANAKTAATHNTKKAAAAVAAVTATTTTVTTKPTKAAPSLVDSGYHGSQSQDMTIDDDDEDELAGDMSTQPFSQLTRPATPEALSRKPVPTKAAARQKGAATATTVGAAATSTMASMVALAMSPDEMADHPSPTQPTVDPSFHSAKEEQTTVVPAAVSQATKSSSSIVLAEVLSSSPFCPVQSPSSVRAAKVASPANPPAAASPIRKPVPAPSSPLQSTTPACPPPRELLSALGVSAAPAASSPALALMQVPPAVPTPPMAAIPAFITEKRTAVAASWQEKHGDEEVVVYEEEAEDDAVEDHGDADEGVLQPRKEPDQEDEEEEEEEDAPRSPSDPSSPVRPVVRKSSMNFASLPARAPFASNKSLGGAGAGLARAGHADPVRTSYYNRPTGGKSLGNVRPAETEEDDDQDDEMDTDTQNTVTVEKDMAAHNKTYAQRLHDRISMLGKSQANAPRPSKSLAALAHQQETQHAAQQKAQQQLSLSPKRTVNSVAAPGAFPEDEDEEDDDWIVPPTTTAVETTSPRVNMAKSLAAVARAAEDAAPLGIQAEFMLPKQRQQDMSRPVSPKRVQAPVIPERTTSAITGHMKSASVPSLPIVDPSMLTTAKPISVSNPTNPAHAVLAAVSEIEDQPPTPSKSPSRNYRDSPLKHVKNKLSSILKTSKGLLASSAALSAEGKSSLLSPSSTRLGYFIGPSTESLAIKFRNDSTTDLARPDLSRQTSTTTTTSTTSAASAASAASGALDVLSTQESPVHSESPSRPNRKTRASAERERRELKHREKELKEVQRMADQMGKLEKMREKEREKARVFVEDQEKTAATAEKPAQTPAQRELRGHKQLQQQQQQLQVEDEDDDMDILSQPPPKPKPQSSSPIRAAAKPTRTSPRKAKVQHADDNVDMADVPASMLPPPPPAHGTISANSSVPRSAQSTRTIRRPIKPTKEAPAKAKQAPTVIRVNTSSSQHQHQQQQSSQFHPSNSILAASLHETLVGPPQLKNKASTASLHTKPSLQSLKSSVSSNGRPKALELAAKRKEAEEREAQRKRDAKAEIERKRAALQEQEEQRKLELQRQREREREQAVAEAASAKKTAAAAQQRQAAIEKAKQTRAPPPVQRTQLPSGPSTDYGRSEAQAPRPQSRLATAAGSAMHRPQEEQHRPVNAVLSHTAKALSKRPLPGTDAYESQNHGRPGTAGGGNGGGGSNMPSYQHKDAKRIRMSEEFDEDELEMGGHVARASSIKGPPVRPSGGFKKDLPSKSVFGNGYSTAPTNVSRDLFKSTVTAQHNHQSRTGHPMDMAQVSKAAISFAPSGNNSTISAAAAAAAASGLAASSASQNPHKTPLRPVGAPLAGKSTAKSTAKSVGKSAAKSSPRFPNGDAIELPDIQTDDEDSEEEHVNAAPWADSPDLRRALMRQETVDPFQVFGPPGPLNMEEVFNKSKDRWHKFRARTSSANWSGADRLTEDDIRKDLAARDKIRREGGWSYDLGKDMM